MATTVSQPDKAPWPHGKLVPIHLRTAHVGGAQSIITVDLHKAEFDFVVKQAHFSVREAGITIEASESQSISLVDNQDTPQTIIASKDIMAVHDAGVTVELTVASHNPIHAGEELALTYASTHANNVISDLHVTLLVEPLYS